MPLAIQAFSLKYRLAPEYRRAARSGNVGPHGGGLILGGGLMGMIFSTVFLITPSLWGLLCLQLNWPQPTAALGHDPLTAADYHEVMRLGQNGALISLGLGTLEVLAWPVILRRQRREQPLQ